MPQQRRRPLCRYVASFYSLFLGKLSALQLHTRSCSGTMKASTGSDASVEGQPASSARDVPPPLTATFCQATKQDRGFQNDASDGNSLGQDSALLEIGKLSSYLRGCRRTNVPSQVNTQTTSLGESPGIPRDTLTAVGAPTEPTAFAPSSIDRHAGSLLQFMVTTPSVTASTEPCAPCLANIPQAATLSASAIPASLNSLEALVAPTHACIVQDPVLSGTPYVVNMEYSALICLECRRAVDPDTALNHVRSEHLQCRPISRDFDARLTEAYPGLVKEVIRPGGIVSPVFGLAIPFEKFFICRRCLQGYSTRESFRKHNCHGDTSCKPDFFLSYVQTFFHGTRCSYFPIVDPSGHPPSMHQSDYQAFKEQQKEAPMPDPKDSETEDYRQLQQFLRKEGWISHVKDFTSTEVCDLAAPPTTDKNMDSIRKHVLSLMVHLGYLSWTGTTWHPD